MLDVLTFKKKEEKTEISSVRKFLDMGTVLLSILEMSTPIQVLYWMVFILLPLHATKIPRSKQIVGKS